MECYEAHPEKQLALIFLDAEKAFDNVSWNFMLEMLRVLEVGEDFERMITVIYTHQKARIRIHGELTGKIQICKGTREGCPLSLLLFIWTLEILNTAIRED